MTTYYLIEKIEDKRMDSCLEYIYKNSEPICTLIIDENYFIKRYEINDFMYYVHIKNGSVSKICIYRERSEIKWN